jgi:hypothetical protein
MTIYNIISQAGLLFNMNLSINHQVMNKNWVILMHIINKTNLVKLSQVNKIYPRIKIHFLVKRQKSNKIQ